MRRSTLEQVAELAQRHARHFQARAESRVCIGCGRVTYPDDADGLWACPPCVDTLAHGLTRAAVTSLLSWLYPGGEHERGAMPVDDDADECIDGEDPDE